MTQIVLNRPEHVRRLDEVVESFEAAWMVGTPDVREFLPELSSIAHRGIAVELLCVDMNYRWKTQCRKSVDDYRAEFPILFSDSMSLQDITHEEFRLRMDSGETASADEYHVKYGSDISAWVTDDSDTRADTDAATDVVALGSELIRLTDAIKSFPVVGDRIGDFELVEELGRGTFGIVFLARQGELEERLVALKITTVADIESRHLARLQHTNIVPIYSLHRFGDLHGICMPFYGRDTLEVLMRQRGDDATSDSDSSTQVDLSESTIVQLTLQMAQGLQHAHERRIVHRDLKPANVLINDDGSAMLLDFNLSHDLVAGGRSCLMVGGTLPYLSPEHLWAIKSGGDIGPQADVYSLGVMLYQLIANRLPFPVRTGAFDVVIDQMIRDRQSTRPELLKPGRTISHGLASIVGKMLEPDTTRRYSTADDVCEDLERHRSHRPLKFAPNTSLKERFSKWSRRHPRLSSAASISFITALLVLTLLAAFVSRGRRIERQNAAAQLNDVRTRIPQLRALMSMPIVDDVSLKAGRSMADGISDSYGVFEPGWRQRTNYAQLAPDEQAELDQILAQTLSLVASADSRRMKTLTDASERHQLQRTIDRSRRIADEIAGDKGATRGALDSRIHAEHEFLRVIRQLQHFEFDQAIPALEALRDADPYDAATWRILGNALAAVGRHSDAENCFTVCISMWPESHWGYFHRGLSRLDMRRYSDAAADFDETLIRKDDYIPALINRGVARRGLKDYKAARSDFDRAIECGAEQTRVYFLRAEVRSRLGDSAGAHEDQTTGLSLTPTDEKSWIKRGLVQLKSDPDAALADFQAALKVNPISHAALRNIAHVYAEAQHRWNESLEVMNQLIDVHNQQLDDVISRGVLLARLGRREDAIKDARLALSQNATAKQLFQVACIYSLSSKSHPADAHVALSLIDRAITLEPKWLQTAISDPDLESIRSMPEFAAIVRSARQRWERNQKAKESIDTAS